MNNNPLDTTPEIDKDYEINMEKKVDAISAKIQAIGEQYKEEENERNWKREPRKRTEKEPGVQEPGTKVEIPEPNTKKLKSNNGEEANNEFADFESYQKASEKAKKINSNKAAKRIVEEEFESKQKNEERIYGEILIEQFREYRQKEKEYKEQEEKIRNRIEEIRRELGLAREELAKETEQAELSIEKAQDVDVLNENKETEALTNITVLEEPKEIKVDEVIDENVSDEERMEISKAFPDENIWDVIKNQVTEQMNSKDITPIEKNKKDTVLKMSARKVRIYLLTVFVSAAAFKATHFTKNSEKEDILSYNNTKVENLDDWENVKLYEDEVNKLENISIITKAHENSNEKFIIIDKQNGKAHHYQGGNLIKSYNVCLGDSMGDEQTYLKSVYKKNLRELGRDEEGDMLYDTQDVSIEEATYVKNGERYLKDGYAAWTDWGTGNMKTGAGIYKISNKGPFLGDYGIFLKNERGMQVATSLHVNSHLESNAPDFRFTNGCVGFSKKDLLELYSGVSRDENIYILPDNPHNKFQIIDGELRFVSVQQNVNRTIRPYEPTPMILKAENPTEAAKTFLVSISENKEKLMKLYPTVSNDIYNELSKIAYGIMGQESTFGTYGGPRGQYGRVKDIGASVVGFKPSVGVCQVRMENLEQKVKDTFDIKNNDDLFETRKNAIAAMSILLDNYLFAVYNNKTDEYQKLAILRYNAPKEAQKIIKGGKTVDQLGPKAKSYIKKVLGYSEQAKVYSKNADRNYFASNWNYNEQNN